MELRQYAFALRPPGHRAMAYDAAVGETVEMKMMMPAFAIESPCRRQIAVVGCLVPGASRLTLQGDYWPGFTDRSIEA